MDFLADAGQSWWQMLPVNPAACSPGFSPYSSCSAFAGSDLLIDLQDLADRGWIPRRALGPAMRSAGTVDYPGTIEYRRTRLIQAFRGFQSRATPEDRRSFASFCRVQAHWLDDYVLYEAIRRSLDGKSWHRWSLPLRLRKPQALEQARSELKAEIELATWLQWVFDLHWQRLRARAARRGIGLIGDIPIFVGYDSADVWAHRELFLLDAKGTPKTVSGYPPDVFSKDGQRWGHPHYDWRVHRRTGFAWWIERFSRTLELFHAVRIDHFLGFHRVWHVDQRCKTARTGRWARGGGAELLGAIRDALGEISIIAEDLGQLTPQAAALRDQFGFPGMRVVQFGFGDPDGYHLPHRFPANAVAYTGTHDNDTLVGWWNALSASARLGLADARSERRRVLKYVNGRNGRDIHHDLIHALMASPANTVIFPIQDVLGLDTRARMNTPGKVDGNWRWRLLPGQLKPTHARELRELTELFNRTHRN